MTKSELINRLAERYSQLVAKDAEYAVKTILDAMTNALASGQRIEIRGFGSFALNSRPPRIGRNPKSGDKVMVPENGCRTLNRASNCANGWMPWSGNRSSRTERLKVRREKRRLRMPLFLCPWPCRHGGNAVNFCAKAFLVHTCALGIDEQEAG